MVRYSIQFKLCIFIILLKKQKVIPSFGNRAQLSSHKLSGDISGVVLVLLVGSTQWQC